MPLHIDVFIDQFPIRLGQFLKAANLVQDGVEAKIRIQYGEVLLNGKVEMQRGKQLKAGDVITMAGKVYRICSKAGLNDQEDCTSSGSTT